MQAVDIAVIYCTGIDIVPYKRSRIHEVIVVRRYSPGYWEFGVGREWERVEKGEVSLRVTRERGGRILSQLGGFQVSKRGQEREQKGISKGRQKARGSTIIYSKATHVYKDCV